MSNKSKTTFNYTVCFLLQHSVAFLHSCGVINCIQVDDGIRAR